jgi:hypothetical protein
MRAGAGGAGGHRNGERSRVADDLDDDNDPDGTDGHDAGGHDAGERRGHGHHACGAHHACRDHRGAAQAGANRGEAPCRHRSACPP